MSCQVIEIPLTLGDNVIEQNFVQSTEITKTLVNEKVIQITAVFDVCIEGPPVVNTGFNYTLNFNF